MDGVHRKRTAGKANFRAAEKANKHAASKADFHSKLTGGMNVWSALGGYPWAAVRVGMRKTYMSALENTSVDGNTISLAEFLATLVGRGLTVAPCHPFPIPNLVGSHDAQNSHIRRSHHTSDAKHGAKAKHSGRRLIP